MTDLTAPAACPVCKAASPCYFLKVADRDYWKCETCRARFLEAGQRLSRDLEHKHYLTHENDPSDAGYRKFLSKLCNPFVANLSPGLDGLDYGCGPGPALAEMLQEAGHTMALYDPFFFPDQTVLAKQYDFITCTEVVEHFHEPAKEFARLDSLLRPGGLLGVMTSFQTDDALFANWHYVKDPTHVVFYREETMQVIAGQFGWSWDIPAKDVTLMRKPPTNA